MKFSIIVPVYNTEKYVGACIESVLNQVYQDFELILVDDGSTDRSGDICEEYAAQDSRIKVFHKSNSGQLDTRCYGIMQSSGQFIVFLDSDDLLSSSALDVINQKICHYHCDMVIYAYVRFFDTPPNTAKSNQDDHVIVDRKDLYLTLLTSEYFNSLCIKAVKRDFLALDASDAAKSVRYGEDLLQTLSIIKRNPKTVIIDDVLYYYRSNANSVTNALRLDQYASDIVSVRESAYRFLLEANILNDAEMYQYRSVSVRLLAEGIANIARAKSTFEHKKELFDRIKESHYYKSFLCTDQFDKRCLGNKRIVWFLFERGSYRPLVFLFGVKRAMKGL